MTKVTVKKSALVCGAGGFIGGHLANRLKQEGFWVRGVDLKHGEFENSTCDSFILGDLRDRTFAEDVIDHKFDEVYQLAADMGGAGYVFSGANDANVMHNSALINLNVLDVCKNRDIKSVLFSSSACIYPEHNQLDPDTPNCAEDSAYPASPDSEYGWEKIFSERLYLAYNRNFDMNCRVARYHNIFGPYGTWTGGKEKAPAAISRKIALAQDGDSIDIWGDGLQTRSFLYVDECLEGTLRLMRSDIGEPVNIGSEEMVTINELAMLLIAISGKDLKINHIPGPLGVRGRNSDNRLIRKLLDWEPQEPLITGMERTYKWIAAEVAKQQTADSFTV